jgi:nucleoside diphosphate kinase
MEKVLSYAIVTPYSVAKNRTGGIIARLLSQADLELVGAQMIAPDENFVRDFAAFIRAQEARNLNAAGELLANYVEKNMSPAGERRHRFLLLIFSGENPCKKLSDISGVIFPEKRTLDSLSGETIRDTYADLILDPENPEKVVYFEPAIMTPSCQELADESMTIFARHFRNNNNIIQNVVYPEPSKTERTLVIIKPDNWNYASSRPGNIIDMFSRTELKIIGTKMFRFSMNQALEFYGPVEQVLLNKLSPIFGKKARETLEKEFSLSLNTETEKILSDCFGREYAKDQFNQIIEFMSGRKHNTCPPEDFDKPGNVKCMILVYEGENAVEKIRDVLGPTDPLKAPGGTVRREFGSNIMVNTAHASDSTESYEREKDIVKIEENTLVSVIDEYLASR